MDGAVAPLPRSLGGLLRYFWSQVLFPGPAPAAGGAPRWGILLLLLVGPGALLYPCLGFALFEPDESRYAQIPREMLARGDLVTPTLQGEPYLDKPPLLYWLVMASYSAFGVHAWAARLVPAVALHATLLVVYLLGRRVLPERAAAWGALVLALAPAFAGMARLLLLDGLLTLWTTLALFCAYEAVRGPRLRPGWWLAAALWCGLGVLTKGPVAVLLLAPPLLLYRWLSGQGVRPGWRGWGLFAGVVVAVALPWYVAVAVKQPGFARYFLWEHNVQRFLAPGMHVRGVWFYVPVALVMLFPGALLAVQAMRFLGSTDEAAARQRPVGLGFVVLAGGWCVAFFTLSACKLPTYILPAAPFLALVLGQVLAQDRWRASRLPGALAATSFAMMLFAHHVGVPWYARYRSPMNRPDEVLRLCADPAASVVCYPRNCDSVAFYLGRSDLRTYRSKDIEDLRTLVRKQPRTVILCTHRHSLRALHELLPPEVRITREVRLGLADIPGVPKSLMKPLARVMGETALGLSDLAVVEMPSLAPLASGGRGVVGEHQARVQIGNDRIGSR
jgi:4-amino-4-deoxy-L-arabinose transferase-like glycosyltransferase